MIYDSVESTYFFFNFRLDIINYVRIIAGL